MEKFVRIAVMLLFLIFIWGCGGYKSPNGPLPDPIAAVKPATMTTDLALSASDSAQANARLLFRDLRGRATVKGEVEVWAYMGSTLVDHARGDIMSIWLALPFDEADFDNDGDVDFDDFFAFANHWPSERDRTYYDRYDLSGNGAVDFDDLFIFADHFGRNRRLGSTKPIVVPEAPPAVTIGNWTANETARAWEILKNPPRRAAKLAQATGHRLVVKSLVGAQFPALDTLVVGDFSQFRNIEIRVNTPPSAAIAPGKKLTITLGDTLRYVVTGLFDSDDKLRYLVDDSAPTWKVASDSILVGKPNVVGTELVTARAVDTAGQSWAYQLTVETTRPADKEAPMISLRLAPDNNLRLSGEDNSGKLRITVTRNNTSKVLEGEFKSPFDTTFVTANFGLGVHTFKATGNDSSGNKATAGPITATVAPQVRVKVRTDAPASIESLTVTNNLDRRILPVKVQVNSTDSSFQILDTLSSVPLEAKLRDGNNTVRVVILDSVVLEQVITRPDRTPPTMGISNVEWTGTQKREVNFVATFSDSMSGVAGYGVAGYVGTTVVIDYPSHAGGRSSLSFSLSATFPTVGSVTRREIKLRARDIAGNFAEKSVFIDQPVSPDAPPPPPPVVVTPPSQPPPTQPPPNMVPTLSATVNGAANGPITVTTGQTLTLAATVTGTPNPTVMWTLGSQSTSGTNATLTAQNGTLTVTATNAAGTVTKTFNIIALGAP